MAYNLRLYSEFTDHEGDTWRVNIYQDSYGGSSSSFILGADGFILSYEGDNQSRYQPIIGSSVEIPFTETTSAHTNFLNAIATSAEGDFTVGIFRDPDGANTLYWGGVLLGEQCVLIDEAMPRRVALKASDDLGNLQQILYNNAGTGYGGHATVPTHLVTALSWVRHSHLWTSSTVMLKYVDDFYPDNAPTASNYLNQVTVYHNGFYNPDEDGVNQFLPIYTILESFATAFNARIFQANGTYWFLPVGAYQYDDTINFYTVTKAGTVSGSSTSLATSLTIDSDAIKLRGYEHSYLPPLKTVVRTHKYSGNIPRIFDGLHTKAEFGTTLSDADFDFDQDSIFRLTGTFRCTQPGDNTTTGNTRLRRFRLRFTLKVGNYYLKRVATFAGTAYDFQMEAGEVLTYTPFTYGATSWELTASTYDVITPYYDVNRGLTGDTTMVLPLDFLTPELTAASNGMDLTLAIANISFNGSASSVTNVNTNYSVQLLRVDQVDEDETNGDEVTYTATGLSSSRVQYEQAKVYVGDAVSTSSLGVLRVVDTPDLPLATGWKSLNYTSTAIGIHLLGVREVLGGQRVHTKTQRGTFYKGPIEMYNLLSDAGNLYLPFQLTFYANRRQVEVESFFVARDLTGITSDDGGRRNVNPPVDGYPGNPDGGLLAAFNTALNNAYQVGGDVLAVDELVTKLYNTFQPVGDDYASTKITYEESKLDGMNVELTQGQITMASSSGNTLMGLRESSPGTWDLYLQDDVTPTPNSVLTMTATAAGGIGLVGINTETPTAPLEVTGGVKITGSITITGTVDGVDVSALKTTVDGLSVGTGDTSNFWAFYLAD
jgi:hypothetical protein